MSQQVQQTQTTKNGISNSSAATTEAETTIKKKPGRPKKEDVQVSPAVEPVQAENLEQKYKYFAKDTANLDVLISRAKIDADCPRGPNGIKRIYCTSDVIQALLMANYNEDPYFIYKDVCLADVDKIEEADRKDGRNYNDMVFRGK